MNIPNYPYYLTVEEYAEALNNAHLEYLKTTHRPINGKDVHHIADLAISSSAFFESAYLVLDSISSAMLDKIRQEETKRIIEDLRLDTPHTPKKNKKHKDKD